MKREAEQQNNPMTREHKTQVQNAFDNWKYAFDYGVSYQKHIRKDKVLTQREFLELRALTNTHLNEEYIRYIELFCKLDKEYSDRCVPVQPSPPLYISEIAKRDLSWRGFWLKATGNDFSIFIHWIKSGIKFEQYRDKSLVSSYIEEHKKSVSVPYAVKAADYIFRKYYGDLCKYKCPKDSLNGSGNCIPLFS